MPLDGAAATFPLALPPAELRCDRFDTEADMILVVARLTKGFGDTGGDDGRPDGLSGLTGSASPPLPLLLFVLFAAKWLLLVLLFGLLPAAPRGLS
jgi:hypothetical protein